MLILFVIEKNWWWGFLSQTPRDYILYYINNNYTDTRTYTQSNAFLIFKFYFTAHRINIVLRLILYTHIIVVVHALYHIRLSSSSQFFTFYTPTIYLVYLLYYYIMVLTNKLVATHVISVIIIGENDASRNNWREIVLFAF